MRMILIIIVRSNSCSIPKLFLRWVSVGPVLIWGVYLTTCRQGADTARKSRPNRKGATTVAVGIELLDKYGISLTDLNLDALVKLRVEYEAVNVQLNGEKDSAESTDSELKKYFLAITNEEPDVVDSVKNAKSEILSLIYTLVDDNPRTIMA